MKNNYKINKAAIPLYLNYQFIPKPIKILDCINNNDNINKKEIINFILKKSSIGKEKTNLNNIYTTLKNNIKKEIIKKESTKNTIKIAIFFSGGIDSCLILYIIDEIIKECNKNIEIHTITGYYKNNKNNFIKKIKTLSSLYKTIHHSVEIQDKDVKLINEIYEHKFSNPIGDTGLLAYYKIIKKLKEEKQLNKFDLIFSGDGADCLFLGLDIHYYEYIRQKLYPQNKNLNTSQNLSKYTNYKINLLKENYDKNFIHYSPTEIFLSETDIKIISKNIKFNKSDLVAPLRNLNIPKNIKFPKSTILYDILFLANNRYEYIKICQDLFNINISTPFLNIDLIKSTLKLDVDLFFKNLNRKNIIKKISEGKLPTWVINSDKEGFSPPFKSIFISQKRHIEETINKCKEIIPEEYIACTNNLIKESYSRELKYTENMKIWNLFTLGAWIKSTKNNI